MEGRKRKGGAFGAGEMSGQVRSCHVISCHVMSCHSMLGRGLKPCDVMLVVEFVELSWPVLGLCWLFGPSWGLRRPMLGSMLACGAHLGGYGSAFWIEKRAGRTMNGNRTENGPNTLSPAACGARRSAPAAAEGPKADLFWQPQRHRSWKSYLLSVPDQSKPYI